MHHPHDQRFKALVAACMDLAADVELERAVHVAPQRIDVAYEPRARVPQLGCMDRMAALGPGMMEYFSGTLSDAEVTACMRKRLNYAHERAVTASRRGIAVPPEPRLWILAAEPPPHAVLQAHAAEPMHDWPSGFWQAGTYAWLCFVVLDALPAGEDTLLLRLFGHGRTLQRALAELAALPPRARAEEARPARTGCLPPGRRARLGEPRYERIAASTGTLRGVGAADAARCARDAPRGPARGAFRRRAARGARAYRARLR